MSKKIKLLLAVTAAVVVLTVGGGVAVIASGTTTTPTTTTQSNPLLAKVAAILGNVTEQQLVDAFKQAREQVSQETITTLLAKAVESGTITAAEKTAIETWLAQKPDGTDKEAMKAWMEKVEERLNILTPNPELEKDWDDLRRLGERYRALEEKCKEKARMWAALKKVQPRQP